MAYSEFFKTIKEKRKSQVKKCCCDSCVLPEEYKYSETILVNDKKACKFCRNFAPHQFLGENQFLKDLNLGDNEKVGITVSGGKDSIYAWKWLVDRFGPDRVVAFTYYKKHLTHPLAIENVKNASTILKSKVIICEDDEAFGRFAKNLEALLDKPDPGMVRVALCSGCRYGITSRLYKIGLEQEKIIKYVSAASYLELAPFKEELLVEKGQGSSKYGLIKGLSENDEYSFSNNLEVILRDDDYRYKGGLSSNTNSISKKDEFMLFDLDKYIPNVPEEVEKIVTETLKWQRPERSWHFDCFVEQFKDIFYYGLIGYTETDFKLSAMVRNKLITREDAINEIKSVNAHIAESFEPLKMLMKELELEHLIPKMKKFYQQSKYLK